MNKKKNYLILSLVLLILGIFLIVNFSLNITGLAFGANIHTKTTQIIGFVLILSSVVLFFGGIGGAEEKELKIKYDPDLGKNEVCRRIDGLFEKLKQDYSDEISNASCSWDKKHNEMHFNFKTSLFDFKGSLVLKNNEVIIGYDIPFAALFFAGKVENKLKKDIKIALAS